MDAFEFQYLYDDKPAVAGAITQALGAASMCWEYTDQAGAFDIERALGIAMATNAEVRRLITFELSALLDRAGVAQEWNDAIETAIRVVEEMP